MCLLSSLPSFQPPHTEAAEVALPCIDDGAKASASGGSSRHARLRNARSWGLPCSLASRLDVDLGCERLVDGALVRDREEPRPLLFAEVAMELDVALDPVEHGALRL